MRASSMHQSLTSAIVTILALTACSPTREGGRACTPPRENWRKPHPHVGPGWLIVPVAVDRDGKIYIAGKQMNKDRFAAQLKSFSAYNPEPAVVLETEAGAPCQAIEQVRSLMEKQMDCTKGGHCDEGIRSVWNDLPYTGQGTP